MTTKCYTSKKSLKLPKGGNQNPQIEEEQYNTMAKRKSTKGQTTIYKTNIKQILFGQVRCTLILD
jgi:hypothetical protein